jgi:hypothetical protein
MKSLTYSGLLEDVMNITAYNIRRFSNQVEQYFLGSAPKDNKHYIFQPLFFLKTEEQVLASIPELEKRLSNDFINYWGWLWVMPSFDPLPLSALSALPGEKIIVFLHYLEQLVNKLQILFKNGERFVVVTVNLGALPSKTELTGAMGGHEATYQETLSFLYGDLWRYLQKKECIWIALENPLYLSQKTSALLGRLFFRNT